MVPLENWRNFKRYLSTKYITPKTTMMNEFHLSHSIFTYFKKQDRTFYQKQSFYKKLPFVTLLGFRDLFWLILLQFIDFYLRHIYSKVNKILTKVKIRVIKWKSSFWSSWTILSKETKLFYFVLKNLSASLMLESRMKSFRFHQFSTDRIHTVFEIIPSYQEKQDLENQSR